MNNDKVRIYELSKELNLENKDILAVCQQLDIAVKSHSSTITEEDAERIRTVAKSQFTASSPTPGPHGGHGSGNAPNKSNPKSPYPPKRAPKPRGPVKKQQILEVRSKQPSYSSDPSDQSDSAPVKSPRPAATPRPMHPSHSTTLDAPAQAALQSPPQRFNSASAPPAASESPREEVAVANHADPAPAPSSHPSRPVPRPTKPSGGSDKPVRQSEASAQTNSGNPAKKGGNPTGSGGSKTAPRPKSARPPSDRSPSDRSPSERPRPDRPGGSRKPPATPQVLELRRPRPARPGEDLAVAEEEGKLSRLDPEAEALVVVEEGSEKPRPRRPLDPLRAGRKGKGWDEEEDDLESRKAAAKTPAKAKRRPHIIEDDEDFIEDLDGDADAAEPATISLSLVRPPKPKTQQTQAKPVPTPSSSRKPRSDSNRDRETRQRRNRQSQEPQPRPESLVLEGDMTLQQLAEVLIVPDTEIIKSLFSRGIMATITQTLDVPTIEMVAQEYGVTIEKPERKSKAQKKEVLDAADLDNLHHRPPVVTVMGHVDHGKTTLLDSIRKTKVAQGEAGGITQHIGAYHVDVEHNGEIEQIVFLDTPGHEAFTAMRARGARVTDIAILVVAADDGVRPQTIEAISHAKAAGVPIIVAINKVDKEDSQPDRVKQELTEYSLVPEEWGGETIMVPVSALKGDNLDTLLEMILLVAEIEELSANPDRTARGTVIEAHLDKARGPVATLLIQNGTLRVGDVLVAGSVFGKVRAMIDDRGNRVESAGPSIPVEVLGLSNVPGAGEEVQVFADEKEARSIAIDRASEQRTFRLQRSLSSRRVTLSSLSAQAQEGELKELNLLLKADVQGSVEAILGALEQLPQKEVQLRILLAAPGEITETDVDLAAASGAVILGFNTTLASGAKRAADDAGVDVREYEIIYKLLEDVQGAMEGLLEPELVEEPLGQAEVRAVFPVGRSMVAGCYVQSGKVVRNCNLRVHRSSEVVYTGTLNSLKRIKEDAKEVNPGYECGIGVDNFNEWKEGDIIETYRMVTKRRTLST